MSTMTPQEIVSELDHHIVGQQAAKRAVAIALRNRWRRQQVAEPMRAEITPKNILMIGPTGVGKTEIARRLAKLADAPFIKIEATKFTEVGYVGKDVDSIVRDLVEVAVKQERDQQIVRKRAQAEDAAEERVLDILVPPPRAEFGVSAAPSPDNTARQVMRKRLREGTLDDREIEVDLAEAKPALEILGPQGMEEMAEQLKGLFSQMGQTKRKTRKLKIGEALKLLVEEEAGKLVNEDEIRTAALANAENNGIVFIDEIDKVASRSEHGGARGFAPRRAARPAAAGGRHVRQHQVRHGQNRPHPVHRLGRLPPRQAERPDSRTAGTLSDPRRTAFAERRRLRGHPHQHPRQPGQAVPGAAGHRRRDTGDHGRRRAPSGADRLRRERTHREHRRAPPGHGDGDGCSTS